MDYAVPALGGAKSGTARGRRAGRGALFLVIVFYTESKSFESERAYDWTSLSVL